MNGTSTILWAAALGVFVALAAEKPVKLESLPAAVQATVKEQTKGAEIKGITQEKEHGKTLYEVETSVNGKTRDMLIDTAGAVVEIEQEVALDSIPAAARAAIAKKAGAGKIARVEILTKGQIVAYEAAIEKGGKKSEFTVAADGTPRKVD